MATSPVMDRTTTATRPRRWRSHAPADVAMRRLLRLPATPEAEKPDANKAFSTSVAVSAVRCLLTYIVLPFVAPAIGLASGVGPTIGLVIGTVAVVANIVTIRRFWRADHRRRWAFTAVSASVIALLLVLFVQDLARLTG
jgi:hypothetical protein